MGNTTRTAHWRPGGRGTGVVVRGSTSSRLASACLAAPCRAGSGSDRPAVLGRMGVRVPPALVRTLPRLVAGHHADGPGLDAAGHDGAAADRAWRLLVAAPPPSYPDRAGHGRRPCPRGCG